MQWSSDNTIDAVRALQLQLKSPSELQKEQIICRCPFPSHKDRTPSFSVKRDTGQYKCWGCGRTGNMITLARELFNQSIFDMLNLHIDGFSLPIANNTIDTIDYSIPPQIQNIEVLTNSKHTIRFPSADNYLKKRCIPAKVASDFEMYYVESALVNKNEIFNRLMVPIKENNNLISIECRDVTGLSSKKVLYPKDSSVNTLYDFDNLKKDIPLYVVEGLMDLAVLRSDDFFRNSTCVFGASITNRQIWMLQQFNNIIIIPDNDKAGKGSVKRIQEKLERSFSVLEVPRKDMIKDVGDIPVKLGFTIREARERGWSSKKISSLQYLTN